MIRTKGEAGTGNVVEAVRHMRNIMGEIRALQGRTPQEITDRARDLEAPADLLIETVKRGRLPVVNFSAGGIATPSDAALMMQMGADGVFVGSGIFLSSVQVEYQPSGSHMVKTAAACREIILPPAVNGYPKQPVTYVGGVEYAVVIPVEKQLPQDQAALGCGICPVVCAPL